jgi:hypothetical protein
MNFALITEGISEYRIIKFLISVLFSKFNAIINQIQPKVLDDKQETPGGWAEVLKYCGRKELNDIFVENDYLIIQIDSDQSETAPFSIAHTKKTGETKTHQELVSEITEKLLSLIDPQTLKKYREKIILAICIHSIECWLLVAYDKRARDNLRNCINLLNREIEKQNIDAINPKSKNSPHSIKSYAKILKNFKKTTDMEDLSKFSFGFAEFFKSLNLIMPPEVQEETSSQKENDVNQENEAK